VSGGVRGDVATLLEGAVLKGLANINDCPIMVIRIERHFHFEPWRAALSCV
jgi:hypothetical protein